ncbi:hypothetical protein QBC46DRAFT_396962 [Diplogelasinospora grovesii]|uniref:Amidohydrolase-related domain-containing protein n=1 Tax=Diplogelasinospora grovesii TaxID=303347 RepID=A0AAN6MY71_9PEZI|nr:hypothetical protein QBC46DRAFT_396962 [Diplogelasinospora grovesii]
MSPAIILVHSSLLFDPKKLEFLRDVTIAVNSRDGSIEDVYPRRGDSIPEISDHDIDLRGKVVMPGFVDSHTHIFLHDYSERTGAEQMRDESPVERVVRATNHARAALLAGYTTYRDLGTESLGSADANLRDCINRGLIPGPRMFVATEALASSGSYEIRRENRAGGLLVPRASDPCDGVDGVRAAVRRRVGDGANIIKFYADSRRKLMQFPPSKQPDDILFPPPANRRNPAVPCFSQEEMDSIVREANAAELPVAAHAGETKAALMAARAGVTSVEHVLEDTCGHWDELFAALKRQRCVWVPTLAVMEREAPNETFQAQMLAVKRAYDEGVRLAAGGDTGAFAHGHNVREMELMVEAGIPVERVLEACTVGGWDACGRDRCGFRFGWFEKGTRADIIALETDPRADRHALRKVSFVMKDGRVWKQNGEAVNMICNTEWPQDPVPEEWKPEEGYGFLGEGY